MSFIKQHYLFIFAAVAVLLIGVSPPAVAENATKALAADSTLEAIKKRGVMKVGNSTFRPWVMRDKKGTLIGYEIDVAKKIAKDMGVKPEFVPTQWDGIIPGLLAGKFDIIIGGMSKTPKRNLTVNFSRTYNRTGTMIAASKKIAADFGTVEDFNNSSVVMACRRGSTACDKVRAHTSKAKWVFFDDEQLALQEVLNGNAHGVPSSWPQVTLWTYLNQDSLHSPITSPIQPNPAALAMRKGDPDFLNFIDNWVEWNEDYLAERRQYWFGTLNWLKEHDIELKIKK